MKIVALFITLIVGSSLFAASETITITEQESFKISLSAATHCIWELSPDYDHDVVSLEEMATITRPRLIGARTLVFHFKSLKPGTTTLHFDGINLVSGQTYEQKHYCITINHL